MTSRLHTLSALGQSVWIDFLSRGMLESGTLAQAVARDAVVGVTSNPTIFAKALSGGDAFDEQIEAQYLFNKLYAAGVDYDDVVRELEREGVDKFADSFSQLIEDVEGKRRALVAA